MPWLAQPALVLGGSLLFAAALHDLATRTIPDWIPLALAGGASLVSFCQGRALASAGVALLVFLLAALCWRRGWMGGGDVKLLGAAALLIPPALVPSLILGTALCGGVLAGIYLSLNRLMRRSGNSTRRAASTLTRAWRAECWRIRRRGPLPYACAIFGGSLFALLGY